jgi:hypothetical protein
MDGEGREKSSKKAIVLRKLQNAIAAREALRAGGTNALRLVDGEGDGLPGWRSRTLRGERNAGKPGTPWEQVKKVLEID